MNKPNFFEKSFQTQKAGFVFIGVFSLLFLISAFSFPLKFKSLLSIWTANTLSLFGKFYLLVGIGAVALLILFAALPLGKIRLGENKPEFSWLSWIAMLYSTGMGAGLLLRAVQEPVYYFSFPPRVSEDPEQLALVYTFFHWGLTPWAFYGLFGLLIAFSLYRKNTSILSSSTLHPSLQKTWLAVSMDSLVSIGTLLGVVASVGLGGRQLLEAYAYWTGNTNIENLQTGYIVMLIVALATTSAILGVNKGIRNLSNFNIGLATSLLLLVLFFGSSDSKLSSFFLATGVYLKDFVPMSLNLGYARVSQSFLKDWTYFYWAFWLAWAPFTGVFIARISKGRTIREFIIGTLLIPVFGTFIWFTVFGSNAFQLIQNQSAETELFSSIYSALFNFFDFLPLSNLTNAMAAILIFTFLITSVDSAIFVLSMFSDNGNSEPKKGIRLFWGLGIAAFCLAVIRIGQESLLEAVSQLLILFALPFSFLFLGMSISFTKSLLSKTHE